MTHTKIDIIIHVFGLNYVCNMNFNNGDLLGYTVN